MQRLLDLVLVVPALVLLSPLALLVVALTRLLDGGDVFFRQRRVGRNGVPFTMLKFRSMRPNDEGVQITAANDDRVTPLGRVLRRTKLDELPALWNILRGDMALVGPRPEVPRYVDLHDPLWREVLAYRPGITDPVTLALRNEEELLRQAPGDRDQFYREVLQPYKLRGYADYGRRRTVRSDLGVLVHTVLAVFRSSRVLPPSLADLAGARPMERKL